MALSLLQLVAFWLAGVLVRARRQAASLAARSAALQRQAEQAAAAERARIARELHDIVAHHLSVVVLHAAGARASGGADPATLEEIENSGRQALAETRRLFGVLRDPDEETGRAPQPGIGELAALAGSLRAAGLAVNLSIDGDHAALPAGRGRVGLPHRPGGADQRAQARGPGPRRGDGRLRGQRGDHRGHRRRPREPGPRQ